MIVDSVESIITFAENDKINLPEILYSKGEDSMTSDVSEAIEVTDVNGQKSNLLILSVDSLTRRATKTFAA